MRPDRIVEEFDDPWQSDDGEREPEPRRPLWVVAVAALVAVGLIIGAVPSFLWPWILLIAFVGFLLWRAAAPRRPGA